MFAWSDYSQQNQMQQKSFRADTKPNGQVSSRLVQRFNSNDASECSNDIFSAYSTTSSFIYDHPTPLESTDGNTHTPEIEDLYWQENYNGTTGPVGELNAVYDESTVEDQDANTFTEQLRSARNSLPSPESTNIATPETRGHSQKPSMNSTILTSPISTPQQSKRFLASLDTEMSNLQDSNSHLYTPAPSSSRIASPAIHISKHSRGDSPARSDFDAPRLSKKRSASNLSQGEYPPDVSATSTSHLLAPPSHDAVHLSEDEDDSRRAGTGPAQRTAEEVPSFEDIERQQVHEKTISEVQTWLQHTSLNPSTASRRRSRGQSRPDRVRSRSTGARPQTAHTPILMAQQHPGPGRLIDEQSEYYYSSDSEYSSGADEYPETHRVQMPPRADTEVATVDEEPLPKQFFKSRLREDPFAIPASDDTVRYQPDTSNEAMYEFLRRARDSETASRAATWGTGRRRLSDGDMDSIIMGENKTRHLSLSKRTRERGTSILREVQNKAKEQLLKRSNSHQKRQQQQLHEHPELEQVQSPEPIEERISLEMSKQQRQNSYPRPISPSISAGLLGATNSLTAVAAGSTGLNIESEHHHTGLIRRTIRRVRSRSDVNKSPKSPTGPTNFKSMIALQGGMPVPSLASPSQEIPQPSPRQVSIQTPPQPTKRVGTIQHQNEPPIKMELSPQSSKIIPTLEGFKLQICELNPRLEPYLVDRIAHDQIRRFKRLVKNKVDHMADVAENKCKSGQLCLELGGEAELLPTRSGGRDTTSSSAQFKITPGADSDNEDSGFDGIVTPAAFPDGIPLPPAKKLPAKFECPLCFQVKSFQKPSDWTKHVHEDVQPFTCTFPNCTEPKSFKRKADWVRHENERHRHLEWWECNLNECTHTCYRKDNFVQHLVREHKRKEPKIKGRAGGGAKGKGKNAVGSFSPEEQEFWSLVDACRHEGTADAKNESCKFCGNNCASWKKLSVHVGKHMEQIAMPVLDLAKQRKVTKDTVISPVEPLPNRNVPYFGHETSVMSDIYSAVSPHTQSGGSNYQSSSAGQSPALTNQHTGMLPSQPFIRANYGMNGMRQGPTTTGMYSQGMFAGNPGYTNFMGADSSQYGSYSGQQVMYPQTQLSPDQYVPRSQGMEGNFISMHGAFDNSSQAGYFSSPEMEQSFPYQMNMMGVNGGMGAAGQQMQTPATSQGMSGNGFVYSTQQQNHNPPFTQY